MIYVITGPPGSGKSKKVKEIIAGKSAIYIEPHELENPYCYNQLNKQTEFIVIEDVTAKNWSSIEKLVKTDHIQVNRRFFEVFQVPTPNIIISSTYFNKDFFPKTYKEKQFIELSIIEKSVVELPGYMLMTINGTTPPKIIHHDIDVAKNEAMRLCQVYNTKVFMLEIVAVVKMEDVPVTERKPVFYNIDTSQLPF